jgi:hypothetical protein
VSRLSHNDRNPLTARTRILGINLGGRIGVLKMKIRRVRYSSGVKCFSVATTAYERNRLALQQRRFAAPDNTNA